MSGMPLRTDGAAAARLAPAIMAPAIAPALAAPPPEVAAAAAAPAPADAASTSAQGSAAIVSLFGDDAAAPATAAAPARRQFVQQIATMVAYWQSQGGDAPVEAIPHAPGRC